MPPATSTTSGSLTALQSQIWNGTLPVSIHLSPSDCRTYDISEPYLIHYPRLSYLAFLLPRLHAFFAESLINPEVAAEEGWLSVEEDLLKGNRGEGGAGGGGSVPLQWHYPLGLLYDLFSGVEPAGAMDNHTGSGNGGGRSLESIITKPWRLTLHYTDFPHERLIPLDAEGKYLKDMFTNAVKEADFIRNGTAKTVMGLGKEDMEGLWRAVETHDRPLFNTINTKLLHPPGLELRHVPMKIYLPTSSAVSSASQTIPEEDATTKPTGHLRIIQHLVPLYQSSSANRISQTLGTALNMILPSLFPSRRNPLLAQPVLHGAVVPMAAGVEDLGRLAAYLDGFLHVGIVMLG